MPDSDLPPIRDSLSPQHGGHYREEDDIELPPMPQDVDSLTSTSWSSNSSAGDASPSTGKGSVLGTIALLAAVLIGGWFITQRESAEEQHTNWQHVAAASAASDSNSTQLIHVDSTGHSQALPAIELSTADLDRSATRQVRLALMQNNLITATAALQSAQSLPSASQNPDVQPPQLMTDSALVLDLKEGRKHLYQIELFDSCDEDGDIVEVLVNGVPFATVPISHSGTMLSIPLGKGNNTVSIRGIRDGEGGVTVSFRTSRGDCYAPILAVGEVHQIGVVVP